MHRRDGFSLVELSIVLVILGLLVGGILAGQSLIRASELRAVSSEYQRYSTAAMAFRDKYFGVPGDLKNATSIWGDDNTNCPDAAITNGTPGTCSGNGDGIINAGTAVSVTGEIFQFWKQLGLAGLIEGTYTGLAGPTTAQFDAVLGSNVPRSKLSGGGWGVQNLAGLEAGDGAFYATAYGNVFFFGAQNPGNAPHAVLLKPEEAWNVDTKMDDGKPGTGQVMGLRWNNVCANAASFSDYASNYLLTGTSPACALIFKRAF